MQRILGLQGQRDSLHEAFVLCAAVAAAAALASIVALVDTGIVEDSPGARKSQARAVTGLSSVNRRRGRS